MRDTTPIHINRDVHRQLKINAAKAGISIREYLEKIIALNFAMRTK